MSSPRHSSSPWSPASPRASPSPPRSCHPLALPLSPSLALLCHSMAGRASLSLPSEVMHRIFAAADLNPNGAVEYLDFVPICARLIEADRKMGEQACDLPLPVVGTWRSDRGGDGQELCDKIAKAAAK